MDIKIELIQELRNLFQLMEEEYERTAESYGFSCAGCEENCCSIGFTHHTVLEYELLQLGLGELSAAEREELREKSRRALEEEGRARCPLLLEGRCRLYAYRPMVCRLHGLPHILNNPARGVLEGTGCERFERLHPPPQGSKIDRTPLYARFAELEKKAREIQGNPPGSRSIPRMILDMEANPEG